MEPRYWVFDWFDASGARTEKDIIKAVNEPSVLRELQRTARNNQDHARSALPPGVRVLAGRGLDLSGELDCWALDWRLRQVNRLLSRVWLYFDFVVVADWLTPELASDSFVETKEIRRKLISDLSLLLQIYLSGADRFLIFRSKPSACTHHISERIRELGLQRLETRANALISEVASVSDIKIEPCDCGRDSCTQFTLNNRLFEHTVWGSYVASSAQNKDFRRASAEAAVARYFEHLVADIWASSFYGASLGTTIESHHRFLAGEAKTRDSVVFQIDLPILNGANFEQLHRLREDENGHFIRFRTSLRRALDERLFASNEVDDKDVAKDMVDDHLIPALNSIRDRLKASEALLNKKSAVGLAMGSLATVCGLLAGAGPVVSTSAGVSAVVAVTSSAALKHLEERRDVELDDAFFLWKAIGQ
jgi:hypothetical protein